MSRIRSTNTGLETALKDLIKKFRFKYRLHVKDLPGKPDIVLENKKIAVFANGCFWHQHRGCKRSTLPKSNKSYWVPKLQRNIESQKLNIALLKKLGWSTVVVWECEVNKYSAKPKKLRRVLGK